MGVAAKITIWVFGGFVALAIVGSLLPETPSNADSRSYGYMPSGQCMSSSSFNRNVGHFINNTDWSQIHGSASFSSGTKQLMGGVKVFDEMRRLGTKACPDLDPLFQQYMTAIRSSDRSAPPTVNPTQRSRVQVKTAANVRRDASASAPIIRTARQGEILQRFNTSGSWVQVGGDGPEGWIAESLLTTPSN